MLNAQNKRSKIAFAIICLSILAVFLIDCIAVNYVVDDAFISFRYAKNAAEGQGLVFNPGERVEGYTNFLWVLILTGIQALFPQADLLPFAQGLGIVFGALLILLVCWFSVQLRQKVTPFMFLAGLFLASHSAFIAWSTGGLETMMFSFWVFSGALAYITFIKTGKYPFLYPIFFVMATLTRPEGLLFFGVTLLYEVVINRSISRSLIVRKIFVSSFVFGLIFVPYFLWRYTYYGYPVPNTFYAKVGEGLSQYLRGIRYLWTYLKIYGIFVFLPAVLVVLRKKRAIWSDYFISLTASYLLYIIYVGGDGLAFFRFIVPVAAFIYILVQEGIYQTYEFLKMRKMLRNDVFRLLPIGVFVAISIFFTTRQTAIPLIFPQLMRWYEPQSELFFPGNGVEHSYQWFDNYFIERQKLAAEWLMAHADHHATVASTPAGSIGYYMNLNLIDMLGLNDVHIAHTQGEGMGNDRAGHEKGDGKYVLARSPEFILMGNVAVLPVPLNDEMMQEKLVRKSEHELWDDPAFHQKYEFVCVRLADSGVFKYFAFYMRKDVKLSPFQSCDALAENRNG